MPEFADYIDTDQSPAYVYGLLRNGFLREARQLGWVFESPSASRMLQYLEDYPTYLAACYRGEGLSHSHTIASREGIVHIESLSPQDYIPFALAHLAASCELFIGSNFHLQNITGQGLQEAAADFIPHMNNPPVSKIHELVIKLQSTDALRIMQILKLTGLVQPDCNRTAQLSLGAAGGLLDTIHLHGIPIFRLHQGRLYFDLQATSPRHSIINDMNPKWQTMYQDLQEENPGKLLAVIGDANETMRAISRGKYGEVEARNLITVLRLDPVMIPNVAFFFRNLRGLIADRADIILTIGAGRTVEQFELRTRKVDEIQAYLKARGMSPIRFILHGGATIEERFTKPIFGAPSYSSYEILYCSLEKSNLPRRRRRKR